MLIYNTYILNAVDKCKENRCQNETFGYYIADCSVCPELVMHTHTYIYVYSDIVKFW